MEFPPLQCPGCDVEITVDNAGGYRTYCDRCVEAFPQLPSAGSWRLAGRYPAFEWLLADDAPF